MANSNNVYATVKPLEGNVSDWVNGQEQMDMRKRAEDREIDRLAQAKKDKEQGDYEKRLEKFNMPKFSPTNVKSVDEMMAKVALKAADKQLEIHKKLKPGISNEEYASLVMQQKQLDNLPDYLSMSHGSFVKEAQNILSQVKEGKIKMTPELQRKVTSFSEGHFDIELDDNLTPMLGLWDKEGDDGKPEIFSYDQIMANQVFGELIPDVNFTTTFQALGEKLGSIETQTDSNYLKHTKKYTPIELAQQTAKAALYDDRGGYSPTAKSKLYDMGFTDFNNVPEEALNKLESDAVEIMMATRDSSDKKDFDYGAITAANKEGRLAREAKSKKGVNEATLSDLKLTSSKRDVGRDSAGNVVKTGEAKEMIYQGKIDIKRKAGNAEESFRSFGIDRNGDVILTVDISEKDENGNTRVKQKIYNSSKQNDEVAYFVQRFKDPDTGEYLKTTQDLVDKIGGFKESKVKATNKQDENNPLGLDL